MSRAKFEEWLNSLPIKPDLRREYDMYKNKHVESRYRGWLAGRESMRDEAAEQFWTAKFGDLEHGVKWLNENAAKEFQEKYPLISEFGGWINEVKP